MKSLMLFSAVAVTTIVGSAAPGSAQQLGQYPFCSQYYNKSSARSCAYDTFAQCLNTVSGIGGYCYRNPDYADAGAVRRARRS